MAPRPASTFYIPWVPVLAGVRLEDSQITLDLIADQQRPSSRRPQDVAWARKGIEGELEGAPKHARSALEETIVELWRMRETLEEGRGDRFSCGGAAC